MKKILCLCFLLTGKIYGFYDIFQTEPQRYKASFKGEILINSSVFSYTNKEAMFSFDYGLVPQDQTEDREQILFKWAFSTLYDSNLNPIFSLLWNQQMAQIEKDLAYTVRLHTGEFLAFNKQGKSLGLGYFFRILFPVVDETKKSHKNSERIAVLGNDQQLSHELFVSSEGWDYMSKPSTDRFRPMFETNTAFINNINQTLQKRRSQNNLYWFGLFDAQLRTTSNKPRAFISTAGFYILDKNKRRLTKGIVNLETLLTLSYGAYGFKVPVNVTLNGQLIFEYLEN